MQRDTTIAIWGQATPFSEIKLSASWGEKVETQSDSGGYWNAHLETTKAGGPFSLTISDGKEQLIVNDILMGEVWLAAGQSNMEMDFNYCCNTTDSSEYELLNADYPDIRMFNVKKEYDLVPKNDVTGHWQKAKGETIIEFSAVAYFFAKKLNKKVDVPIGIINASWGSSEIESWIERETLEQSGLSKEDSSKRSGRLLSANDTEIWFSKWKSFNMPSSGFDLTLATYFERVDPEINYFDYFIDDWRKINFKDEAHAINKNNFKDWPDIELPTNLSNIFDTNDYNGVTIIKNQFLIEKLDENYHIDMGTITLGWAGELREYDFYLNGIKIGSTFGNQSQSTIYKNKLGDRYRKNYSTNPFKYDIDLTVPDSVLKIGTNEIAIRVIGSGNMEMISLSSDHSNNLLDNIWSYRVAGEFYKQLESFKYPYMSFYIYDGPQEGLSARPKISSYTFNEPGTIYNGMIHPLIPFTMKGVIWYQGESNAYRYDEYEDLFSSLILDWRKKWDHEFPFYYVQIAPYFNYYGTNASLREVQRRILKLPKTGMVVTLDIGENYDIHPSNKHDVGYRLADIAIQNNYGGDGISSGPLFKDIEISQNKIKVFFDHVGLGLLVKEKSINEFEIAGHEKIYFKADVKNKASFLEVSSKEVSRPMYVRYAWSDTSSATLYNLDGYPASSFSSEL